MQLITYSPSRKIKWRWHQESPRYITCFIMKLPKLQYDDIVPVAKKKTPPIYKPVVSTNAVTGFEIIPTCPDVPVWSGQPACWSLRSRLQGRPRPKWHRPEQQPINHISHLSNISHARTLLSPPMASRTHLVKVKDQI